MAVAKEVPSTSFVPGQEDSDPAIAAIDRELNKSPSAFVSEDLVVPPKERPLSQQDQAVEDIIAAITRETSSEATGEQTPPVVPAKDTEDVSV